MRWPVVLLLVTLVPATSHARPGSRRPEPQVKAQFFERFIRFVEWPEAILPPGSPFTVCLTGNNELAAEIEALVRRLPVKGRPTRVRRLGSGPSADPEGCDAIYIDPTLGGLLESLLVRTRGRPTLTVADTPGFCKRGVIINMLTIDGYVRFEVNAAAARAAGLRVSSQLLRLARVVEEVR